jgi:hypothetical protein
MYLICPKRNLIFSISWYFSLQFPIGEFYCHPCVPKICTPQLYYHPCALKIPTPKNLLSSKHVLKIHPYIIIIHVVLIEYFGIHPWGGSKLTVYKSSLSHAPILFFLSSVYYRIDWYFGASIHPSNSFIHPRRVQLPIDNLTGRGTLPQGQERVRKSHTGGLPDGRLSARTFGRFCGTFSAMAIDNAAIVAGRRRRRSKRRRTTSSGRRRRRSELVGSRIFSLL